MRDPDLVSTPDSENWLDRLHDRNSPGFRRPANGDLMEVASRT